MDYRVLLSCAVNPNVTPMNLNKEIQLNPKAFFRWWGEGLMAWLSDKLWDWLFDRAEDVVLKMDTDQLRVYQHRAGQESLLAAIALSDLDDEYAKLLQRYPQLEKGRFILHLNNQQAIQKIIVLPSAVKDNLTQVLRYELDKYTPFSAEQVYLSTQVLSQPGDEQLKVLLVLTPRETLDALMSKLAATRIQLDRVEHENKLVQKVDYNLLPEEKQRHKNRLVRMLALSLVILSGLFLIGLLVMPVITGKNQVDEIRQKIRALGLETEQVQQQQLAMDRLLEQSEQIVSLKQTQPFLNEILNELTRLLPDNTWLRHFKFQQGKIQIQGQSSAASSLIEVLESSPLFENVRFISPLTQDKRTGQERFRISAEVVGKDENNGK